MNALEQFTTYAANLRAPLDVRQVQQIVDYGAALELVNQTMNLTRIPASEYLTMHVLDSLIIASVIDASKYSSLLDVGTGAGFPAVPMAIAFPHLSVMAMDARNKKLLFIQETVEKLGIQNLSIIHARAEQLATNSRRQRFDIVTSRALANYETLLEWQLPFVENGGCAIMLKSTNQESEISSTPPKGWNQTVHRVALPGTEVIRLVVVLTRAGKS